MQDTPHLTIDENQPLGLVYQIQAITDGTPAVILSGVTLETGQTVLLRMSAKMLLTVAAGVQARAEHDGLMGFVQLRPNELSGE